MVHARTHTNFLTEFNEITTEMNVVGRIASLFWVQKYVQIGDDRLETSQKKNKRKQITRTIHLAPQNN